MKFINLVFDGIANQKGTVDFANKVAASLSVTDLDKDVLREALSFALFGSSEDTSKLTVPARSELLFSAEDTEYTVIRIYDKIDSSEFPIEIAVVTDSEQNTVYAEGAESVNAFVASKIHFSKKAFNGWFCVQKEELYQALSADTTTRESFISVALDSMTSADEVNSTLADLKLQEKAIAERIESIAQVSRKEIKNYQLTVDTDQIEVNNIRKDISLACDDIAKIKEYDVDTQTYFEKNNALEKLLARNTDTDAKQQKLNASAAAKEVADIFADYLSITEEAENAKKTNAVKEAQLLDINKKITEAEASAKTLEKDFIYINEKNSELQKALHSLIQETSAAPQNYKIKDGINLYYKDTDAQAADLIARKNAVDAEYDALSASIAELQAKKLSLRNTPAFKKAVTEATIIETDLKWLNSSIKTIVTQIEDCENLQNVLYEEHTALSKKISTLKEEQDKLEKLILGGHADYKEAINADVVYKQTLYAKHLIVSSNELELDAIQKKIASVKIATEHYEDRLSTATARKKELSEHIGKLNARLVLLDEKYTEYSSLNKLHDLTDNIVYGSRCPVCDSFVTTKNDFEGRDTKAIETQIISINAEISKCSSTLDEIIESIGQYGAAKMVSSQYLDSLVETAEAKKKVINGVLAEYSANSVGQLFAKLKIAIIKSNELTNNLDKFRENQATLNGLIAKDQCTMAEYTKYTNIIAVEKAKYEASVQDMRAKAAKYADYQNALNGENAEDLALKQQILDAAYSEAELEQEAKQVHLNNIRTTREELANVIALMSNRAITIDVNGNKYDYTQVVTQVIMNDLGTIISQIDANLQNIDVAKVRLSGIRKFIAKANEQKTALSAEILAESTRISTASKVSSEMFSKYEARVSALNVTTQDQIEALILDNETTEKYTAELSAFNAEVSKLKEDIAILQARTAATQPYYDNKELIYSHYEELKAKEQAAIVILGQSQAEKNSMVNRYNDLIDSNKKLAYYQGRIKGIENNGAAITEGAIIAKDFAALIIEKANALVKNWSNDSYYLDSNEDGSIVLINNAKGKEVKVDKYTKTERMLMLLGLSLAYSTSLSSLIGCDFIGAINLGAEENDKASISVAVSAGKEQELIAIPLDEAAFMRTASKL